MKHGSHKEYRTIREYSVVLLAAVIAIIFALFLVPDRTRATGCDQVETEDAHYQAAEEEIVIQERTMLHIRRYMQKDRRIPVPRRTRTERRGDEPEAVEEAQEETGRDGGASGADTDIGENSAGGADTDIVAYSRSCAEVLCGSIEDNSTPGGEMQGSFTQYEEAVNESETGEEVQAEAPTECIRMDSNTPDETHATNTESVGTYTEPSTVETVQETQAYTETRPTVPVAQTPQEILQNALNAAGIGWWWPYAYAQVMQESHWNPGAISADGQDYGLLQYRLRYWTQPENIFDVSAQIRVYVSQVSARLAAGLSIEETISRHYTSDYVPGIDWTYVNAVLSWIR